MSRIALLAFILVPASALAHSKLAYPEPINQSDANKNPTGPCGAPTGTPPVSVFQVGSDVEVSWYETINHVGGFEIRFSANDTTACTLTNNGQNSATGPNQTTTQNAANRVCPTLMASVVDPDDAG